MTSFLVQIRGDSYADITTNRRYVNPHWMDKPKDQHHGEVQPGDRLLLYCSSFVRHYERTLAFRVDVEDVSPDRTTFTVGELHRFRYPLERTDIRGRVDRGELDDVFKKCGQQGFNIAKLEPAAAAQALDLVESMISIPARGGAELPVGPEPNPGSPVDHLIELQLEQWMVDNWSSVDFGAPLRLYEEDGEPVGQQYDTGIVGRIDLLCEDASSGALVVVELKKGRQSDDVVGQLARYMGWVKENLAEGRAVEGVVLAPAADERLRYAAMAIPGVRLLRYETRFEVFPL